MSQQINLFNPVFLKQQKVFSLLTMMQALAMIIVGSGVFYGYAWYQVQQLTLQYEESDKRFKKGQRNLERYTAEFSPEKANKLLRDEVQGLERKYRDQDDTVNALKSGAVGNTNGYSGYMQAFSRQLVSGLWLTHFTIIGDGAQIRLRGGMLSPDLLPTYLQRLSRESMMQGRTFSGLEMQQLVHNRIKEAAAERARIAAAEAEINAKWTGRPITDNPFFNMPRVPEINAKATLKERQAFEQALAEARKPRPPKVDYITFSLHSDEPAPNPRR